MRLQVGRSQPVTPTATQALAVADSHTGSKLAQNENSLAQRARDLDSELLHPARYKRRFETVCLTPQVATGTAAAGSGHGHPRCEGMRAGSLLTNFGGILHRIAIVEIGICRGTYLRGPLYNNAFTSTHARVRPSACSIASACCCCCSLPQLTQPALADAGG